jgi:cobalt-precorrin 5A hydrolase/precorrin-3B C17-methyltransferase
MVTRDCLAIVILGSQSLPVARQIQAALPQAVIYGLATRVEGADYTYTDFGETVRELFKSGTAIVGGCAAGILIRTLAPCLTDKWQEPPVLAVAEDGSAVVPLLGGLQGVNQLARQIGSALNTPPAITTTGEIRFQTALLAPPAGYQLLNPEDAKTFAANLLAGAKVRLVGNAPWLANLAIDPGAELTIVVTGQEPPAIVPGPNCLVYQATGPGTLAIVGTGPGSVAWLSPEARLALQTATDWVGYKTYLDLVEPLRLPTTIRHASDNRVEIDRAIHALDLAAQGRSVAVVSSGDPGIYAMAAAVFEALDHHSKPAWQNVEIQVCPGISAMQAAAALAGAPLGHDFCAISLSDIRKPWEVIAQRIQAVAVADLAIAFYNPVSQERRWQLGQAKEILLGVRSPQTPVILARSLGRPGQHIKIISLGQLQTEDVDMQTVLIVGSSKTRLIHQGDRQWVYTPRSYSQNETANQ